MKMKSVCVCLCIQVVVYCLSIFLKKKICGGNVCGKRVVPFLLSGRKRRGNATGDSDGVAAVIVTQSCPTLRSRGLQHARLPCPTTSPRVCANSCPLSQWCHPTISSFVTPFPSCLKPFPASGSFLMSQLFPSSGQSTRASTWASVLSMKIQGGFSSG